MSAKNAEMLVDEYLFTEGDKSHWVPVIKTLTPYLEKELKEGDRIIVYYFLLASFSPKKLHEKNTSKDKGPYTGGNETHWIFAVEEFQKDRSPQPYISQPLDDAIDRPVEKLNNPLPYFVDSRQVRSRSRVIYTGKSRAVSELRLQLLGDWIKTNGLPQWR